VSTNAAILTLMPDARAVIERVYAALEAGDRDALLELLAPDLDAQLADGMPAGAGPHRGADAMISDGWWAIGRTFSVRAIPQEWIACAADRLLVRGRYRGTARTTGRELDAAFDHLWTVRAGRAVALRQLTDTALWVAAADEGEVV
jgi:2-(1,2-epoxy-1,2-dihydrophenyl)acetyl-CoA isomerase